MINYGYTGYDFEIDSAFHRNSVYFAITRPKLGIVMTEPDHRPTSQGLPFEIGLRADGSSYRRTTDRAGARRQYLYLSSAFTRWRCRFSARALPVFATGGRPAQILSL